MRAAVPRISSLPPSDCSDNLKLSHNVAAHAQLNAHLEAYSELFQDKWTCEKGKLSLQIPKIISEKRRSDRGWYCYFKKKYWKRIFRQFPLCFSQCCSIKSWCNIRAIQTHEIYYVLKYFVKNKDAVDNIAPTTLPPYTKKLEKETNSRMKELKLKLCTDT